MTLPVGLLDPPALESRFLRPEEAELRSCPCISRLEGLTPLIKQDLLLSVL